MSEFFQPLDPAAAPDPVTPADGPGDAAGYSEVTPSGQGPAPYSISAPQDIDGIGAAVQAAMDLTGGGEGAGPGAGIPDRDSPRQQEAAAILNSPQGSGAMNVLSGFPDYEDADVSPGADMETPIQGHTDEYPGTMQDGIPQYGGDEGGPVPGVPDSGSMDTPGGNYPGTIQSGLTTYGTS